MDKLVVEIYVDDLVIIGSSRVAIQKSKMEMTKLFKMSDLGLLYYYLGLEVKQQSNGFVLNQASYGNREGRSE
jgi:hypothetical protein